MCMCTGVSIATLLRTAISYSSTCTSVNGAAPQSLLSSRVWDAKSYSRKLSLFPHILLLLLQDLTPIQGPRMWVYMWLGYVAEVQPLGSGGSWWKDAATRLCSSSEPLPAEAAQLHSLSQPRHPRCHSELCALVLVMHVPQGTQWKNPLVQGAASVMSE